MLGYGRDGAEADYCLALPDELAPKPCTLDDVQAAGVPLSALTAWQALFDHARLMGGQSVLIHGAAGGVVGKQPYTRVCQEEGKVAYANAFEEAHLAMERQFLGHAIFTDPEIGSVGLTERDARAQGYDVAAGLVTFDQVEKAELIGETTGLIKYVIDRTTRKLLGGHVVGPQTADPIYDAIIVMRHGGSIDELAKAVGIFPTLQEGMEGTARGVLRRVAPREVAGSLVTARIPLAASSDESKKKGGERSRAEKFCCPAC
jgi:hypothetical protein